MSELTPELAPEVVAACQTGAEEAAGALSRSLDGEFAMTVGEAGGYSGSNAPAGFDGAGLAVMLKFGGVGVAALLPEASGLLPDWYADPDPTGESKLSTLAQELSMLLVPESLMAQDFQAAQVANLNDALAMAQVADGAMLVPLELSAGGTTGQLSLIWPLAAPDGLLPEGEEDADASGGENTSGAPAAESTSPRPVGSAEKRAIQDFSQLPEYTRSLLKIELPVNVVLASKKENMRNVVALAPGAIIKFEKGCDEMLHLYVGEQKVALGEAVKVGDKFGLRVSNMELPDEHFMKVQPRGK